MSDFDVFDDADPLPSEHLLDELESIKDILRDGGIEPQTNIPLLDDMVVQHLDDNAKLLDLNRIFEEDADTETEPELAKPTRPDIEFPRFQLNTMLPEEPAESTPAIEPTVAAPVARKTSPAAPRVRPDYSREVLIQELIDEFIPEIEAALHERLSKLDDATLKRWKKPE